MPKTPAYPILLTAMLLTVDFWLGPSRAASGDLNVTPLARMLTISLTSDAFENGQPIPKKYTKEGDNVSPGLKWSGPPEGAKQLVLMLEDPEGTGGNFSHWVAWGIPTSMTSLPEGVPKETSPKGLQHMVQGLNGFLQPGYDGPLPWPGSGPHHYMFRIFALDKAVQVPAGSFKEVLQQQMYGHVIAQGLLVGTYERRK